MDKQVSFATAAANDDIVSMKELIDAGMRQRIVDATETTDRPVEETE